MNHYTIAPPCPAIEISWLREIISRNLLESYLPNPREPIHLLHPPRFRSNCESLLAIGQGSSVDIGIRFGKKSNKSPELIRECAELFREGLDVGVDSASIYETRNAVENGIPGPQIVITGPTKHAADISFARQIGATLALSRVSDIKYVSHLLQNTDHREPPLVVTLRVKPSDSSSRFGMTPDEILSIIAKDTIVHPSLHVAGLSFHLSGYSIEPRAALLDDCLPLIDSLRQHGHNPRVLSIGGGFPSPSISFNDWSHFTASLDPSMWVTGSVPHSLYPFGSLTAENFLKNLLHSHLPHAGTTVANAVIQREITLLCEPGRALCRGVGASVFPVLSSSKWPTEYSTSPVEICVVSGLSMSLSEQWFDSEFCPDPLLIRDGAQIIGPAKVGVAVAGCSCLESDYLSRRFIPLPEAPRFGDFLLYPDTAGYQMDSNESSFHDIPIPSKIIVDQID